MTTTPRTSTFVTLDDLRAAGLEPVTFDNSLRNDPEDTLTDGAAFTHRGTGRRSHRFAIVGDDAPRFVDAFEVEAV